MNRISVACLVFMMAGRAGTAGAITGGEKPGSATVAEDPAGREDERLRAGSGWTINAGYFFKDSLFYGNGRGGLHVNAGRVIPLPHRFGLWAGAGAFRARGTVDTSSDDGSRFRTTFDSGVFYADLGVLTPWTPFPFCVAVYRHSTSIRNRGVGGPLSGAVLDGSAGSWGVGLDVHLLYEHFFSKSGKPPRGLGLVLGYVGFIAPPGRDVVTRDDAGNVVIVRKWKPLAGESLRAGLEYEF